MNLFILHPFLSTCCVLGPALGAVGVQAYLLCVCPASCRRALSGEMCVGGGCVLGLGLCARLQGQVLKRSREGAPASPAPAAFQSQSAVDLGKLRSSPRLRGPVRPRSLDWGEASVGGGAASYLIGS